MGLSESGDKKARKAADLLDDFDRILITLLLGTNLVQVALSACFTLLILKLYGPQYVFEGTLFLTAVQFIFAEMIPKRIAKNNPTKVSIRYSSSLSSLIRFFSPVTNLLTKLTNWISTLIGDTTPPVVNEDELDDMVEAVSDTQDVSQGTLLRSALRFDDCEAESIMTPIQSVIFLDSTLDDKRVLHDVTQSRHSRLPVIDGN